MIALRSLALAALVPAALAAQADLVSIRGSELREYIEHWNADRGSLGRRYGAPLSSVRRERLRAMHTQWRERLQRLDFAGLSRDGQVAWLLFDNHLRRQIADLDLEGVRAGEVLDLLPWAATLTGLVEARQARALARVGHEPANATAEVRRSIVGNYGPLYQAGYMLGGLQLRALQRELVGGGKLSEREFHDRVLQQNSIPIEMVRAALWDAPLAPAYQPSWRFYDGR